MQYRELFQYGMKKLTEAGISEVKVNVGLLLEWASGLESSTLYLQPEREVSAEAEAAYRKAIDRRADRYPLQYITGEQYFMGLRFQVSEDVLIPRQDTEILVERVLRDGCENSRILDLCTGSGCILISLLMLEKSAVGAGVDISEKALQVAECNAEANGLLAEGRAVFLQSDLYEKVEGSYDIIVSNPPYIEEAVIGTLMPEVRDYEPRIALDGGTDGFSFYRRILEDAGKYLEADGKVYLEIGCDQAKDVCRLMENNGFSEVRVVQDYAGLDRVVCGCLAGK